MTRRVPLPSEADIATAVDELSKDDSDHPPAVLAVAKRLGLSNATFWRHFPQIAQTLADTRKDALRARTRSSDRTIADVPTTELVRLRNDKARLEEEMRAAAAEVQRLTLENHELRTQLEQSNGLLPFNTRTAK